MKGMAKGLLQWRLWWLLSWTPWNRYMKVEPERGGEKAAVAEASIVVAVLRALSDLLS